MISIKKFLVDDSREITEACQRMSFMLLQAIVLHAVEGDPAEYETFRLAVGELEKNLAEDPSPANILVTTGAAVNAMQSYNRHTSQLLGARSSELQGMVGMLTAAMSNISAASQTSVARLQDLQRQIEQTVVLNDVRSLKQRLSECLESMRVETERQRVESAKVVSDLKQGLRDVQTPAQSNATAPAEAVAESDPLTGLPLRAEAEQAIQQAGAPGAHAFVALFVLSRLQAITTRYGSELADCLRLFFLQRLSLGLSPQDQFFRWSQDSFLALMHRKESAELLRRELSRLLSVRMEKTFEIASRTVTLPISPTWTIVPLFDSSHAEVMRKLELFVRS